MYRVHLPLPELYICRQCCADFIECGTSKIEVDKTFVRTK